MPIHKPIAGMLAGFSLLLAFPENGRGAAEPGEPPLEFNDRNWPPSAREGGASGVPGALDPAADESKVIDDWTLTTKAAIAGDVDAAYRLGRSFAEKRGTRATERALDWLGRAADAGHADAMFHLSRVLDRLATEEPDHDADLLVGLDARERDAEHWLRKARELGSLEAYAWGCGPAFASEAQSRLQAAASVDCYLGLRVSEAGSPSRKWFRSKWDALPRAAQRVEELPFRAALVPFAHLIPGDAALLETRIEPPSKTPWSHGGLSDLLPLATGNSWTWQTPRGEKVVERVTQRHSEHGREWFQIETQTRARLERAEPRIARLDSEGLHETNGWLAKAAGLTKIEFPDAVRSSRVFPFPAGKDSVVVVPIGPTSFEVVRVVGEGIAVQTPAGRFECMRYEVRSVDLEGAKPLSQQTFYDFAPGIGLVRVKQTHGGKDLELTEYDVSNDGPAAID